MNPKEEKKQNSLRKELFVNEQDDWGFTALHYASLLGFVDVCNVLLDNGSKVDGLTCPCEKNKQLCPNNASREAVIDGEDDTERNTKFRVVQPSLNRRDRKRMISYLKSNLNSRNRR